MGLDWAPEAHPGPATALLLRASLLGMSLSSQSGKGRWMSIWVLSILTIIAACGTISPRRLVVNNPSPTPTVSATPIGSPTATPTATPFPTVTTTPTPTPTPTAMAAVVPSQFLFTADPSAGVILGFKINRDGGLSPVPGSPFVMADSPRLVAGTGEDLFVAGKTKLTLFRANKDTGTISQADVASLPQLSELVADSPTGTVFASTPRGTLTVRVVNRRMEISTAVGTTTDVPQAETSVRDASGRFLYTLNPETATISVFNVQEGARISLGSYPAGHGSTSLAIVKP